MDMDMPLMYNYIFPSSFTFTPFQFLCLLVALRQTAFHFLLMLGTDIYTL